MSPESSTDFHSQSSTTKTPARLFFTRVLWQAPQSVEQGRRSLLQALGAVAEQTEAFVRFIIAELLLSVHFLMIPARPSAKGRVCDKKVDTPLGVGSMPEDERCLVIQPLLGDLARIARALGERGQPPVEMQASQFSRVSKPQRRADRGFEDAD